MDEIIKQLRKEVEIAKENDEIPVGAVIVDKNNKIIAEGHNDRQYSYNVLGHAEINAIINAEKKTKDWRLDGYTMYISLEPCKMCSIIIKESRLDKVYFFVERENKEEYLDINIEQIDNQKYIKEYTEFKRNIVDFFKNKR